MPIGSRVIPLSVECLLLIIAVWSKGMNKVRAKIIRGSAGIILLVGSLPAQVEVVPGQVGHIYWRSAAAERLQQVSKVLLIVEHRLVLVL